MARAPKVASSTNTVEKRALRRKAIIASQYADEPCIDAIGYNISLIKALNYYNVSIDDKVKVKWVLDYVGKNKATSLNKLSPESLHTLGALVRLKTRDQYLEDKELKFIDEEIDRLCQMASAEPVSINETHAESIKKKPSVQDKIAAATDDHIAEFNGMIDSFIKENKEPDFAEYLKAKEVSAAVSKGIPRAFESMLEELRLVAAGTDKDLVEGYSNLGKVKLKKLVRVVESISTACEQHSVTNKAAVIRKPRAKKEVPVLKQVEKVLYMKEAPELGLKSVLPSNLIGASIVFCYNTRYNQLQMYKAIEGSKIAVKGTKLLNYDTEASGYKSVKDPQSIKSLLSGNKAAMTNAYKTNARKEQSVNGRINQDTIILRVF